MHSSDLAVQTAAEQIRTEPGISGATSKTPSFKVDRSDLVLKAISYLVVTLFALFCLLPFVLMLSASFSSEAIIRREGFGLWPKDFSLTAYEWIFQAPRAIMTAPG